MSESKECESVAAVTKQEQAKPKPTKDKGNRLVFLSCSWEDTFTFSCCCVCAETVCEFSFINMIRLYLCWIIHALTYQSTLGVQ